MSAPNDNQSQLYELTIEPAFKLQRSLLRRWYSLTKNRMHISEIALSSQQNLTPNQPNVYVLLSHTSVCTHALCMGTYVSNTPREDITIVDLALVRHASGWRTLNTLQLLLVVTKLCVRAGAQSRPCAARRERPARSHHPPRRTPRTSASQGIRVRCRQGGWIQYR